MAQTSVRIAAGAGVVAASLLIVGPNPAEAGADRHGSGHSNDDYRKNGSGGGYSDRGPAGVVNDVVDRFTAIAGLDTPAKPNLDPPKMDLGSSGSDSEELFVVQSFSEEQPALRSAAVAEVPVGDNLAAAAVQGGGGSGYSGQPAIAFRAPEVTFGNGRTPGTKVAQPPTAPRAVYVRDSLVAPQTVPAAPSVPTAIEIFVPPLPPPLPPIERIRPAVVTGQFVTGTTDTVTDPLAGVAGLILIPAVGAVLGYRQARAAQSLRASLRAEA